MQMTLWRRKSYNKPTKLSGKEPSTRDNNGYQWYVTHRSDGRVKHFGPFCNEEEAMAAHENLCHDSPEYEESLRQVAEFLEGLR